MSLILVCWKIESLYLISNNLLTCITTKTINKSIRLFSSLLVNINIISYDILRKCNCVTNNHCKNNRIKI